MSLKEILFQAVKTAYPSSLSINDVEAIAHMQDKKVSNAERRLRELCDGDRPLIRTVRNEKGYIVAYLYQPESELKSEIKTEAKQGQNELFNFNSQRQYL